MGRSARGRLPRTARRGLGVVTGVGEREGSFSLEALASESESDSESDSAARLAGIEVDVLVRSDD